MVTKVRVDNLSVDQFVQEGYNLEGKLLVTQFSVNSEEDIDRLKDIGVKICYLSEPSDTTQETSETEQHRTPDEILDEELNDLSSLVEKTEKTYQTTLEKSEELFEAVQTGKTAPEELRQLEPFVDKFMDFMNESASSISILTQIQRHDKSTYDHSINVAILSMVYGNYINLNEDQIFLLGYGGLLHDIGKTQVSRRIIQKPDNLNETEWEIVKRHPEKGREILEGEFDDRIVKIAHEHHEKPDGSGYPRSKESMDRFAKIVSVVDAYEALTAERPYRDPMNPLRAYQVLKNEFYSFEDTRQILQSLIHCMGLFPVGSVVELTNGDLAVVLENHPSNLKSPRVRVVKNPGKGRLKEPYQIDLDHIQNQKQVINDRIYDSSIEIERIFDFSKVPELRKTVPKMIESQT